MEIKQLKWFALEIEATSAASEAIEFALNELGAIGTAINNLGKQASETLKIVGYFNDKPDDEAVDFHLSEALRIYDFGDSDVRARGWRDVVNEDWLAEWKKHWKPTVTDRYIIAPTWEIVENTDKIVIRIEPSMAFGTGTHETTKLCLGAIGRFYKAEMSFLDVGTGTGILAIAAAKVQTPGQNVRVLGCDTDVDSIRIAKENAELNETPAVELYVGSIDDETPVFDFVCANLTADVILPILPLLVNKSSKFLVLSGILKTQETLVADALVNLGGSDFKIETDGEWISVCLSYQVRSTA